MTRLFSHPVSRNATVHISGTTTARILISTPVPRGKGNSNDANAEYIAAIRAMMDRHGVAFQTAELGKIDVGGGGTIAYITAQLRHGSHRQRRGSPQHARTAGGNEQDRCL